MDLLYAGSAVVAAFRLVVWAVVVFVLVPRLIFRDRPRASWRSGALEHVVQMAFVSIVVVNLLVLLHLFDQFSLAASFGGVYLARLVLVRKVSLRSAAMAGWRRTVILTLDTIEAIEAIRSSLRPRALAVARSMAGRVPRGSDLAWMGLFTASLAAFATLQLSDALLHPASDVSSYLTHLTDLKALGSSKPVGGTPGVSWLIEVLRRVSNVDEAILLRVLPALLSVLDMAVLMWAARRLRAGHGGALLAGAGFALLGLTGWLPVAVGTGADPITVGVALALAIPTVVFGMEAFVGRPRSRLIALQGTAAVTFVWPAGGLLTMGSVLAAGIGIVAVATTEGRPAGTARTAGLVIAGYGVGLLSLAAANLRELGPTVSPFDTDVLLGRAPPGTAPLDQLPHSPPSLAITVAVVMALGLVLVPSHGIEAAAQAVTRRALGTALLAIAVVVDPARFNLPALLPEAAVAPFAVTLVCLEVALLFALGRDAVRTWTPRLTIMPAWRSRLSAQSGAVEIGVTLVVLAILIAVLGPVSLPQRVRVQSDAVVSYLYQAAANLPPYQWTVVSTDDVVPQVSGFGFFVDRAQFLTTYDPAAWRFDPRKPELSVPTPNVLVLLPDDSPAQLKASLTAWMDTFARTHPDEPLTIEHPEPGLTVYRMYRSPEEEARILEQIRLDEKAHPTAPH